MCCSGEAQPLQGWLCEWTPAGNFALRAGGREGKLVRGLHGRGRSVRLAEGAGGKLASKVSESLAMDANSHVAAQMNETTIGALAWMAVLALLAGAVFVRDLAPPISPVPEAGANDPLIPEPMQLLKAGGEGRLVELDALVEGDRRVAWVDARLALLGLVDCPSLVDWIASEEGRHLERQLALLTAGNAAEALGALSLLMQLARSTEWNPGFLGGPEGAERLGGLLREWLDVWSEKGAAHTLLFEPTLAAAVFYGRVMRIAYEGNMFRSSEASRERARLFVRELTGIQGERRTTLGIALELRFPGALSVDARQEDFLEGFEREAALLFPKVNGKCDG